MQETSELADLGSIPGQGRSPGEGTDNPLLYSCVENSKDRGAWWAPVHGATKSRTRQHISNSGFELSKSRISFSMKPSVFCRKVTIKIQLFHRAEFFSSLSNDVLRGCLSYTSQHWLEITPLVSISNTMYHLILNQHCEG